MNFFRHRSGSARILLAWALCGALLLASPGSQAIAAQAEGLGGELFREPTATPSPLPTPTLTSIEAAQLPNVVLPVDADAVKLEGVVTQTAQSERTAQVQRVASAAQAVQASAQATLRAGGERLAKADGPSGFQRVLGWLFGERSGSGANAELPSTVSDDSIRFYIAEQGQPTISGKFSELGAALKKHPELAKRVKIVRLATAKKDKVNPHDGLVPADAPRIQSAVGAQGLETKLELERVPVDWQRHKERQAQASTEQAPQDEKKPLADRLKEIARHPVRAAVRALTFPVREAAFLVKTYVAGMTAPTRQELIGAAITKIPPFIIGVGVFWKIIGPSHPILLASAILLSGAWEAFHGVLLNSWNTFQNNLYKSRGGRYQSNFNWLYGQLNPAIFRTMSWSVDHNDPNRVPFWKLRYWFANFNPLTVAFWFAMGPISVVGTFIGTLAYRGLNSLYENANLTRGKRSGIQQGRDFVMMVTGILLGAGMAKYYVLFFLLQQAFDLGTYVYSLRSKGRPVLYVTDETVAGTKEFNSLYPVEPNPTVEPALKTALRALGDIPVVYVATLPFRWLYRLFHREKKK